MPIGLSDAINRAELMSENGLLPQQSYELILQKLGDDDRHSFTMALVDRSIIVKTSNVEEETEEEPEGLDPEKMAKQFTKR